MRTRTIRTMMNTFGATLLALSATGASAAAPPETTTIWRAQVTVGVCNATNAETSDPVKVRLNGANMTVLNSPIDDFKQGSTATFDLVPFNPSTGAALRLSDVTRLQVVKDGSNGLMLCRLTLSINQRTIYHTTWASPGYLLDNTSAGHYNSILISGTTLRASSYWQNYGTSPLPFSIPASSTRKRVEGMVATAIYGEGAHWRSTGVSVVRKDATAIRVGVDLKADVSYFFDPNVDIDFDLRFSCSSGVMTVSVQNYTAKADSAWYAEVISLGLINFADMKITDVLRKSMLPSGFSFRTGICPKINVDAYGNVGFSL